MTLSKMTFSIMNLIVTFSIQDNQQNDILTISIMDLIVTLSITIFSLTTFSIINLIATHGIQDIRHTRHSAK